jgi:hypothetical protein
MHQHHIIPRSCGGSNDAGNLVLLDPLEHALLHALDFIEGGPWFDFRHEGWPLLSEDIKTRVKDEASRRTTLRNQGPERPAGYSRSRKDRSARSKLNKERGVKPPGTKGLKKTEEERRQIGERNRINMLGRKCFNDGTRNVFAYECPPGFIPGRLRRP